MTTREKLKTFQFSKNVLPRLIYKVLKPVSLVLRIFTDTNYRRALLTRLKYGKGYFQRSTFTKHDRYPKVFAASASFLEKIKEPKILSFGCSTGEEVDTLSRYMPHAAIIGVDINDWCLDQCRAKYNKTGFKFYNRQSPDFIDDKGYDAIFCMAVFQHTNNRTSVDNTTAANFTFEKFEIELIKLDKKLKSGGLLIVDNTDFDFSDLTIASHYEALSFPGNRITRKRPLFNNFNQKVSDVQLLNRVFKKIK